MKFPIVLLKPKLYIKQKRWKGFHKTQNITIALVSCFTMQYMVVTVQHVGLVNCPRLFWNDVLYIYGVEVLAENWKALL